MLGGMKFIYFFFVTADGVTYCFGIFYDEFLDYFKEGKGITSWILSILVGITLCSGKDSIYLISIVILKLLIHHGHGHEQKILCSPRIV